MNQTTLVLAAVLAATALIIGTAGTLQPAAAHHQKSHIKLANNIQANQDINQNVLCSTPGSTPQAAQPGSTTRQLQQQLPTSSKHRRLQPFKPEKLASSEEGLTSW
jgi:hypothetical protein